MYRPSLSSIIGVWTNPTSVTTSLYRLSTELDRRRLLLANNTATLGWRSAAGELALSRLGHWVSDAGSVSHQLRGLADALERHEHQVAVRRRELEQLSRAAGGLARGAIHGGPPAGSLAGSLGRLW